MHWMVGIDASLTGFAVCGINGLGETKYCLPRNQPKLPEIRRCRELVNEAMTFLRGLQGEVEIYLEDYAFGRNTGKMMTRAELVGYLKQRLWDHGVEEMDDGIKLHCVSPRSLKLFTTGYGGANKSDMITMVLGKWGFNTQNNDDLADAYALAQYGWAVSKGKKLEFRRLLP